MAAQINSSRAISASLAVPTTNHPQGLFVRRTSCHQSVNPRPARAQRRGTTRMKPPPGVPWDAGGGATYERGGTFPTSY